MEQEIKFSVVIGAFGDQADRFCLDGYKNINKTLEQLFIDASKIKDLSGVELVGNIDMPDKEVQDIKRLKEKYNLDITCIVVDIFTRAYWGRGSITSKDKSVRQRAIDGIKRYMDIAKELDCNLLDIWPGQDGYDYYFQSDYLKDIKNMVLGLKECADYRINVKIGLEFKIKEPRTHCYMSSIGKTLFLLDKINKENVGIIVDVGHSLFAYENMAETVALCKYAGNKLFHLHLNDNYGYWDDDMMIGSVHIPEYLELLYWLKKIDYSGWYSLDIFPYREDGIKAVNESIQMLKSMISAINNIYKEEIENIISSGDATKALALIRRMLFK